MAANLERGCAAGGGFLTRFLILLAAACVAPSTARSAAISATAGFDYAQGPGDRLTRSGLAVVGFDFGRFALGVAGVRWDDRFVGPGTSAVAALGVPMNPGATLRVQAVRFFPDEGARAWSLKLGPQLSLAGRRATISYLRYQDDAGFASSSGLVEAEVPLAARWTGRANGSYTRASEGASGVQGALGLGWSPAPSLTLIGELGVSETDVASPAGPATRPLLPFLGSPQEPQTESSRFEPTVLLGIRISTP